MLSNKQVVRDFYTKVINEKRLDLIEEYVSPSYVAHGFPYVGMGVNSDSTSGDKIVVTAIVPGSPADGKLEVGDEILMAKDDTHTWEGYQTLKNSPWGWGEIGTQVTVRVKRGEQTLDIPVTRGLVPGSEIPYDMLIESFKKSLTRDWPDLEVNVEAMVEEDDLVACLVTQQGANSEFERSAVWPSSAFYKFEDGKIVEGWGVDDNVRWMMQMGYDIEPPTNGG